MKHTRLCRWWPTARSWVGSTTFPVYPFAALLGVVEIAAAVLLAIKPIAPRLSIVGSLLAILLFVSTVSFLFTTPGVAEAAGGGFPALSLLGEFLLKDVPLLGLSFWTLADSIRAADRSIADCPRCFAPAVHSVARPAPYIDTYPGHVQSATSGMSAPCSRVQVRANNLASVMSWG